MKKFFLAALTVLSLGVGVANAESLSHSAPPHQQQQSGSSYNWLAGGD
jgi:hypothetical protein